jgi:hypothetical protein
MIEIGVFDHVDRGAGSLGDLYENRLKLIEAYDRLGIRRYHLAEHHATPLGMARSGRGGCASARWSIRSPCIIRCASSKRSACSTR